MAFTPVEVTNGSDTRVAESVAELVQFQYDGWWIVGDTPPPASDPYYETYISREGATTGQVPVLQDDGTLDFETVEGVGGGGVTDHGALTGLSDDDHTIYALADGTRGTFATSSQGTLADTAVQPGDLATVATSGAYTDLTGLPAIPNSPDDIGAADDAHTHPIADLTATGTPSDTTFLRGDGTWATPPSGGEGGGVTDHGALTGLSDDDHTIYALADGTRGTFATSGQGTLADTAVQPGDLATVATSGAYADLTGLPAIPNSPDDIGAANASHTHPASEISDATATGEALVTATDAAAARTAIGAGTSNLALGTTSTTAKVGDWQPGLADLPAGSTLSVVQNGDESWPDRLTSRTDIRHIWIRVVPGSADPASVTSPAVNGAYDNDVVIGA